MKRALIISGIVATLILLGGIIAWLSGANFGIVTRAVFFLLGAVVIIFLLVSAFVSEKKE